MKILEQEEDFKDSKGRVNRYAMRAHLRLLAYAFYLHRWRRLGHERAAAETCAVFGHERHGARCDRCGTPVR